MHQSVIDVFRSFSVAFEGSVDHLYLDIKGLATAGIGNLADPVELALKMPWLKDGGEALPSEVRAEWARLKAEDSSRLKVWQDYRARLKSWEEAFKTWEKLPPDAQKRTPAPVKPTSPAVPRPLRELHYKYAAPFTSVRLSQAGINLMVQSKLLSNEKVLRGYFAEWDEFSADAQLGISSMAWALGPAFPETFKNFKLAVHANDWAGAVASCKIREDNNPGVVPRNAANRLCFGNAATVLAHGMDRSVLHYPNAALPSPVEDAAPPTLRDLITEEERARIEAQQFNLAGDVGSDAVRDGLREMSDTEPAPPPSASERRS